MSWFEEPVSSDDLEGLKLIRENAPPGMRIAAAGNLCTAFATPFSAHTAPSLHAHAACALPSAINVEYFFDHYRIEQMFFDGALKPSGGLLRPDSSRPGFGLECKMPDMEKYKVYGNVTA